VEDNIASYRLFLALGFKEEARLREQNFSDGHYQDVLRLGLLKKEYVRLKKAT
jgi:RimJ/RimL family protein N-acetyltransferase